MPHELMRLINGLSTEERVCAKFYDGGIRAADFDPAWDYPDAEPEPDEQRGMTDDEWLTSQIHAEQWLGIDPERFWDMTVQEWNKTTEIGIAKYKFYDRHLGRLSWIMFMVGGGKNRRLDDFLLLKDSEPDDESIFSQIESAMDFHGIPQQTE